MLFQDYYGIIFLFANILFLDFIYFSLCKPCSTDENKDSNLNGLRGLKIELKFKSKGPSIRVSSLEES